MSLQQLRYKQNPVVDFKIEGETEGMHVAPLLFIHLLENAYKHSPAWLSPGDLKMRVEVIEDALTFSVENPVGKNPNHALDEPGGIGLPNVRKRLALLYPGRHTLEINSSRETFALVLKIYGLQLQTPKSTAKAIDAANNKEDYLPIGPGSHLTKDTNLQSDLIKNNL
jgi:LytS/YehU family sensor histidine kinase